jgi:hypothetical protein
MLVHFSSFQDNVPGVYVYPTTHSNVFSVLKCLQKA